MGGPALSRSEALDLLAFVTDVAVSMGSLLQACNDGGDDNNVSAAGARPTSDPGVMGATAAEAGLSPALALRLQSCDGEVAPEGFAAALALTFEGSLPTLEGVLLGEKVGVMSLPSVSISVMVWKLTFHYI